MWKRKIGLKEQYGTIGHFLKGDEACHYLGQRYIEGTNFYARREWRGVRDTSFAFAHWLKLWVKMAGLVARNPVRLARAFFFSISIRPCGRAGAFRRGYTREAIAKKG